MKINKKIEVNKNEMSRMVDLMLDKRRRLIVPCYMNKM